MLKKMRAVVREDLMTGKTIAVIGATGRTGRPLVRELSRRGVRVLCLSRGPRRPDLFDGEVEWRLSDLCNVETLAGAFRGADSIHYIPPSLDERDPDYVVNIIDAAEKAGVARVVYHSVLHSNTPEMPHHIRKAGCERLFRHSNLAWTILQPAMYVQTALTYLDAEAGVLSPPYDAGRPFTLVDEADLAEAAAIVHTNDDHAFATYELAGIERLDFVAMGKRLGAVLGRPIEVRAVDTGEYVARFAAKRGLSAGQARERLLMFDYYDRHGLLGNGNVLRMILGREPTGFGEAARRSLGVTAGQPAYRGER
jgi:uncharacterized protein YbjT (DUF2867 family)